MAEYIVDALVYKMAYLFEYSSEQFQTVCSIKSEFKSDEKDYNHNMEC